MSGEGAIGGSDSLGSIVDKVQQVATIAGKGAAWNIIEGVLKKRTVAVFQKHGPEDLERYIIAEYPLVEEELPEPVKNALQNLGPRYGDEIAQYVTPEHILHWMENPEWLDNASPRTRKKLQESAAVIRETPEGEEWLAQQVYVIYRYAGIVG